MFKKTISYGITVLLILTAFVITSIPVMSADCASTGYLYGNWSESEHINTTLEEQWLFSNDSHWSATDESSWWPGNYTLTFNASLSQNGGAVLNNSGTNRSQEMGWVKLNCTPVPNDIYLYIIYAFKNESCYDMVLFKDSTQIYLCHWNGTNLTELGTTQDDISQFRNYFNPQWEHFYPSDPTGVYWKLIYNAKNGSIQFKMWGPELFSEPVGWIFETYNATSTYTTPKCHGIGVWNPTSFDALVHWDLINIWQLNYTTNSSASFTINGETPPRPHMDYPVINLSNFTDYYNFLNNNYSENFTDIAVRNVMRMLTNDMNMESRQKDLLTLEMLDQNDTVYYYSAMYDNMIDYYENLTEEAAPPWLNKEYLHLHVQVCTDGEIDIAGSEPFYDDTVIGIDVDNDGNWDSNDRLFWFGSDGLRIQYNGNLEVTPDFNASVWLSENNASGNLHRYNSYMNYGFNLPLSTLVKSSGYPLNESDVFGLCIITFDDGAETTCVWQNWNETSNTEYYPELTDPTVATYFLNYTSEEPIPFPINSACIERWGEGVITGSFESSGNVSHHMTIEGQFNQTHSAESDEYIHVNTSIWVNNTGSGNLTEIYLNLSIWNCSCSDLLMDVLTTSHGDFVDDHPDDCYVILRNVSIEPLEPGNSWFIWIVYNITNCSGVDTATEYLNITGNASELLNDVVLDGDDGLTFSWGEYATRVCVDYEKEITDMIGLGNSVFAIVGILMVVSAISMVVIIVKKFDIGW